MIAYAFLQHRRLAQAVGLVAEHLPRWCHSADHALGDRAVVRFRLRSAGVCECMVLCMSADRPFAANWRNVVYGP